MRALAALFLVACGALPRAAPVHEALPAGVTAFDPTGPDTFAPLRAVARDADLLGLGESVHGSAGYARVQRAIVSTLVEHEHYRAVLFELASDEHALHAAYRTCAPAELLAALYRQGWKDYHQERLELHAWLCAYNRAHPDDPVTIGTFDPQKPWEDVRTLRRAIASPALTAVEAHCFGAGHPDQLAWAFAPETAAYFRDHTLDAAHHAACTLALDALATQLGPTPSDATVALAGLRAWQDKSFLFFSDPAHALAIRETQMTANVYWRWSRAPRKTIVLAHNLHVAKLPVPPSRRSPEWDGLSSLGHRLAALPALRYRAIAVTAHRADAIFGHVHAAATAADSLSARVLPLGPSLLLDPRAPWLAAHPWSLHDEDEPTGRRYDLARAFDLIVFLDHSPAATMLPKPE